MPLLVEIDGLDVQKPALDVRRVAGVDQGDSPLLDGTVLSDAAARPFELGVQCPLKGGRAYTDDLGHVSGLEELSIKGYRGEVREG